MSWLAAIVIPFAQGVVFMWGIAASGVLMHYIYEKYLEKETKKDGKK